MNKIIIVLAIIAVVVLAGYSAQQTTESNVEGNNGLVDDGVKDTTEESKGLLEKVTGSFSSDVTKLKKEFEAIDENQTSFTDIDISKDDKDIKMDFVVTPNITSEMFFNMLTLEISIKTYEVTQDFENLKINYLDSKKKVLGTMTIPQKAINDMADYAEENQDDNYLENPYLEPFWSISQRMYDESVPEMIPTSMAEGMYGGFGNDADDIAEALAKDVTHLEIDCGYSDNWDADADNDGITYDIQLLSSDNTVVPLEGTFETKVYERIPTDDWGFEFEKGKLLYSMTGDLKGQDRLQYFDSWSGYSVQLSWDDVESYMASSNDYGIMYVTFTDLDGNSFEAKTGEGSSYDDCRLRES